jgi:hypothetical protein
MNDLDVMARFYGAAVLSAFQRCPPFGLGAFEIPEEKSQLGDLLPSVAAQYREAFAKYYGEGVLFARKTWTRGQHVDRALPGECPSVSGGHLESSALVIGLDLTPGRRCVSDSGWVWRDHAHPYYRNHSRALKTRLTEYEELEVIVPRTGVPSAGAVECRRRARS